MTVITVTIRDNKTASVQFGCRGHGDEREVTHNFSPMRSGVSLNGVLEGQPVAIWEYWNTNLPLSSTSTMIKLLTIASGYSHTESYLFAKTPDLIRPYLHDLDTFAEVCDCVFTGEPIKDDATYEDVELLFRTRLVEKYHPIEE